MEDEILEVLGILHKPTSVGKSQIDLKECSASDYVKSYIFPVLLPAIHEMLAAARQASVFERKRTKFNACDFLTEYLYNKNPKRCDQDETNLWEIPFVQDILKRRPRPPLPLSLVWTEEKAALVIQSFWRGYLVRRDPEVQELREYQREMRESSYHIMFRVDDFWKKQHIEDSDDGTETEEQCEDTLNIGVSEG